MTRTMLKYLGVAGLVALTLAISLTPPAPAAAQVNPFRVVVLPSSNAKSVSTEVTAVSTAPALLIKYVGTSNAGATLAVTTDDFIFTTDGTTADPTINVQATTPCGASVGTLDTGDTDCNTVIEVINEINASANWLAIPIGVLGTDNAAAYFADVTEVSPPAAGTAVFNDSAATLQTTNAFTPGNRLDIRDFMQGNKPAPNPWASYISVLEWYIQNFVGSAGAGALYGVTGTFGGASGKVYSETVRTVYSFTGSATGVDKELAFQTAPIFLNPGEHFVYRGASGTTHTSPVQRARGFLITR